MLGGKDCSGGGEGTHNEAGGTYEVRNPREEGEEGNLSLSQETGEVGNVIKEVVKESKEATKREETKGEKEGEEGDSEGNSSTLTS